MGRRSDNAGVTKTVDMARMYAQMRAQPMAHHKQKPLEPYDSKGRWYSQR
jgi:hypothetical protein